MTRALLTLWLIAQLDPATGHATRCWLLHDVATRASAPGLRWLSRDQGLDGWLVRVEVRGSVGDAMRAVGIEGRCG